MCPQIPLRLKQTNCEHGDLRPSTTTLVVSPDAATTLPHGHFLPHCARALWGAPQCSRLTSSTSPGHEMTRNLLSGTRHVPVDLCFEDVLPDRRTINSPHTANSSQLWG